MSKQITGVEALVFNFYLGGVLTLSKAVLTVLVIIVPEEEGSTSPEDRRGLPLQMKISFNLIGLFQN